MSDECSCEWCDKPLGPDEVEAWPGGPRMSRKVLAAENKRMREEGRIVDVETKHGIVTMYKDEELI